MSYDQEQLLASVFRLGEGYFGIPAAQIQEVVQPGTLTPVHHAPPWVSGIRNLRGRIVTVIDLKAKLGLGSLESGASNRILMVDSGGELLGLLVEGVEDTIFIDPGSVSHDSPEVDGIDSRFLRGIYPFEDRLLALLDHDAVLRSDGKGAARDLAS